MKTFLSKNWALIGFIIAFLIDDQTGFLKSIIASENLVNVIKGIGAILLAYFWNTPKTNAREIDPNQTFDNSDPIKPGGPKIRF